MLSAGLRLVDLVHWDSPALLVHGERVVATHDAYAWLAGAERVNQYSCHPLAFLLRLLHASTGIGLATLAFWLPVVMAPMAALPIAFLGLWWRLPTGTLVAGVLCTTCGGYLIRTRLGFYDTDPLALFFTVALAAAFVCWLEPHLSTPRKTNPVPSPRISFALAFLIGIWIKLHLFVYPSAEPIILALFATAVSVGLVFSLNGKRLFVLIGLLVAFLAGNGGWAGLAFGGGAALAVFLRPELCQGRRGAIPLFLVLLTGLILFSGLGEQIHSSIGHIIRYGDRSSTGVSIRYPATISTIIEARTVDWHQLEQAVAGSRLLLVIGTGAYAFLCWRNPAALVFAPLLFLAMASTRFGARFSMYGGVVVGLGLGFGLSLLCSLKPWTKRVNLALQLLLLASLLWLPARFIHQNAPFFFISKPFAEALAAMRPKVSPDAQFWIWWDFGYACQFYSGVSTFADGARNSGEYILPLARVHATASPGEAHALIRFVARQQALNGNTAHPCADRPVYPNPISTILEKMPPQEARSFFEGIGGLTFPDKIPIPQQYLVLAWENIRISKAIRKFGTWDIVTGETANPSLMLPAGRITIDTAEGSLSASGKRFRARTIDVLSQAGNRRLEYPWNRGGMHVLNNQVDKSIAIMDEGIYRSMMVQMLIGEPKTFARYFELVLDRSPAVRIFRLKP